MADDRDQFARLLTGRLVLLREALGWSQAEMAAKLGITLRAYRAREQPGRHRWLSDHRFILRLAEETSVSWEWLLDPRPGRRPPLDASGRPLLMIQ